MGADAAVVVEAFVADADFAADGFFAVADFVVAEADFEGEEAFFAGADFFAVAPDFTEDDFAALDFAGVDFFSEDAVAFEDSPEGASVGFSAAAGFAGSACRPLGAALGISAPIPRPSPRFFAIVFLHQSAGSHDSSRPTIEARTASRSFCRAARRISQERVEISCAAARYARAPVLPGS